MIDTCLAATLVVLSMVSFDFALLKAIVLVLLRDKKTPIMLGDTATLMARNLSVKNQNKLKD